MKRIIIILSLLLFTVSCTAQTPTLCTQASPCVQQCWFTAAVRSCTWVPASQFKGPKGDPGNPGLPGQAATISVGQTNTLPSGSAATVTNSGTAQAAIFNFGIPMGPLWVPPTWLTLTTNPDGTGTLKLSGTLTVCDPTATKCPQWNCLPVASSPTNATLACTVAP